MILPKYEHEPKLEKSLARLRDIWNATNRIPGCTHDPPCKASRWSVYKLLGGAFLVVLLEALAGLASCIGYFAHFRMALDFARSTSLFLNNISSKHWEPLYWSSILPFLVATFLSLRTFEHAFNFWDSQTSRSIPRSWTVQFLRAVNLTLFSVVLATSSIMRRDWDGLSGQSAVLALGALGASILFGLYTGAYRRDDWKFRESLGFLVRGDIRGPLYVPGTLSEKEHNQTEAQSKSTLDPIQDQMNIRRVIALHLLLAEVHVVYVDIAQLFWSHSLVLPRDDLVYSLNIRFWLPPVFFWCLAIHIFGTLMRVVAMKRPISCFGKSTDLNLLRLCIVLPPIIILFVPGGLRDGWKALVIWTLSLTPCIVIGLSTGSLRLIWTFGIRAICWRLGAAFLGIY